MRELPQPQRKPEVRANRIIVVENLLKVVVETPLTRVLAGIKSASRLKLVRWFKCDFEREKVTFKIHLRRGWGGVCS